MIHTAFRIALTSQLVLGVCHGSIANSLFTFDRVVHGDGQANYSVPYLSNGVLIYLDNASDSLLQVDNGLVTSMMDTSAPVPNLDEGVLTSVLGTDYTEGVLALHVQTETNYWGGLSNQSGEWRAIVDTDTTVGSGTETLDWMAYFRTNGERFAALARTDTSQFGVYSIEGNQAIALAQPGDPVEGSGSTFDRILTMEYGGDDITFVADSGERRNLYRTNVAGEIHAIIETPLRIDSLNANIERTGVHQTSNQWTAVRAALESGGVPLLLTDRDDNWMSVAHPGVTSVPGMSAVFDEIWAFEVSDGRLRVAFDGRWEGGMGLFAYFDQRLDCIIKVGDTLDARTIEAITVSLVEAGFLDDDQVAFRANFTDGSSGIYVATLVPEPTTATMFAIGLLIVVRRRRRPDAIR
ncbi:MAG: PEP-CTERM sorting domain-containing protein [Planctomycetales bacterium]|nr:PEP-CTERM sorting domain-containing protein [Planctomycetales bacterium]